MSRLSPKPEEKARQEFLKQASPIVFEEEASREGGSFFDYLSIWYGVPKIGKTTLLSKVEGAYFLPTEPGFKHVKVRKTKVYSWKAFLAFLAYIDAHPSKLKNINIFVVDPVDKLAKYCMHYVCGREKIAHPTDQDWGKGWEAFRDEWTEQFMRLCAFGKGVAVLSHIKERDVVIDSMELTKEGPAMPKTAYTVCNDLADIIVRVGYAKKGKPRKRCLYIRGTNSMEAGDRTGMLPPSIAYTSEAEVMKKFLAYCEGKETPAKRRSARLRRRK